MKNILLDFIPFQFAGGVGGAPSFTKAVVDAVIDRRGNNNLFALYDSSLPKGKLYDSVALARENGITLFDLSRQRIADVVEQNHIDTFFISIGQFYAGYDLSGIGCKTIMFIHDIFDVERNDNDIDRMLVLKYLPLKDRIKRYLAVRLGIWKRRANKKYAKILPLYCADSTCAYTVSEYTRNSLEYYFGIPKEKVSVCYSPLREMPVVADIENSTLKRLVANKEKYVLFLAANREYKNFNLMLKVFPRLRANYPDLKLLTLGWNYATIEGQVNILMLSDADLRHAYLNACVLVFPSLFEGFGYPPVEAMQLGTPVAASNVASIPELLKGSCVTFSPFYPADFYRAVVEALEHGEQYKAGMAERYYEISRRQASDFGKLIDNILN